MSPRADRPSLYHRKRAEYTNTREQNSYTILFKYRERKTQDAKRRYHSLFQETRDRWEIMSKAHVLKDKDTDQSSLEECCSIPAVEFQRLVEPMPESTEAELVACGGPTTY